MSIGRIGARTALLAVGVLVSVAVMAAPSWASSAPQSLVWSPTTSSGTFNYGTLAAGEVQSETFMVENVGGKSSGALTIALSGASAFTTTADNCTGRALGPKKSCTVTVRYAPTASGASDSATLVATGTQASASITLEGQTLASGIIIPKGHTATLTNAEFNAADALTYGYQLNGGENVEVGSQEEGGGNPTTPDVTLGPFSSAQLIRVFLTDNTCGFTYYSDGNHGEVKGSNPFGVEISDAGGPACPFPPSVERKGIPNLALTLTIN
jgi:hypothetical protein